jgi:septum formation protein
MIDEKFSDCMEPAKTAEDFAVRKVKRVIEIMAGRLPWWICGADTIVSVDDCLFGKPKDREDAGRMIKRLSGREHKVTTAIALYGGKGGEIDCRSTSCVVRFAELNPAEIEWYLDTGEWQEAAGAYRLQGLAGCFIVSIQGSPSAVVGLPLHNFYDMLRTNGYPYGAQRP